jgi:regulator of cell morphogenesis and NO signaling
MAAIEASMKVGDVARIWPETMSVFARYKLDLCCGGAHPLDFVARKHGLDLEQILRELNAAVESRVVVR